MTSAEGPSTPDRHEARVLGRYMLGQEPPTELLDRYIRAHGHLSLEPTSGSDAAIVRCALKHRWLLGPLDAATALRRPDCALRRKIMVMCAIVEASPEGARLFTPKSRAGVLVLARTLARGAWATLWRLALGWPVLLIVGRSRAADRARAQGGLP